MFTICHFLSIKRLPNADGDGHCDFTREISNILCSLLASLFSIFSVISVIELGPIEVTA